MLGDPSRPFEGERKTQTIHQALSSSIVIAQCCGMMPIAGITDSDYRKLKFDYFSVRFFYTALYMSLLLATIGFYIAKITVVGVSFGYIVTILFFGCSFVTSSFFIALARQWPDVMKNWCEIDEKMRALYGFPNNLHTKLRLITTAVIGAAILEHSLYVLYSVQNFLKNATNNVHPVDAYFQIAFEHVFRILPYHLLTACLVEIVNLLCTFTWNYMDLFIMLTSTAVASRFAQVNRRLERAVEDKVDDVLYWMEIRDDYNSLNLLSKTLDKALSDIVLLSFTNNLFVILVQLLHTLQKEDVEGLMYRLYFVYSFGFLFLRTFAVALYASKVHSKSVEPVDILNQLPSEIYNIEVERLVIQIKMDPSGLSGRGLFKVKKSIVLSIAGAIVSYELIFIQFTKR